MTGPSPPSKLGWHSLGTSFYCPCGETHRLPIDQCHVGLNAAETLAHYARTHCGDTGLVLSDVNTRHAAGEGVFSELSGRGKKIREKVFDDPSLDATEETGDALAALGREADFYVSVGSGTLTDLAKYAGGQQDKPVLVFPTAASMNGYTSGVAALKVRGLKRTLSCPPARGVFANPEISARAPVPLAAAGVADFLSKCSSSTDWQVAHVLREDYYCGRPREFFEGTQTHVLDNAAKLPQGDVEAHAAVLDALLLSGCSMVVAGSSAPASGGEHLISHYLDMKSALYGFPHDLHGAQVGVGTLYCLDLWEKVLSTDPDDIDVEVCVASQPGENEIEESIRSDWGATAGEVMAQWRKKSLSAGALRAELTRFKGQLGRLREACAADLLPASTVAGAITAAGGPIVAEDLNVPLEEYRNALSRARYVRGRFTVLDLGRELCLCGGQA